jgi:hypothetical protein
MPYESYMKEIAADFWGDVALDDFLEEVKKPIDQILNYEAIFPFTASISGTKEPPLAPMTECILRIAFVSIKPPIICHFTSYPSFQ